MPTTDVCLGENLTFNDDGELQMAPWTVPMLVKDVMIISTADGDIIETIYLPGKRLMDQRIEWRNDTPVSMTLLVRVTRRWRRWIVTQPNAIQFRDRWSWAIDAEPEEPNTGGIFNSQCGAAVDLGTDTVAEPLPGKLFGWWGTNSADEWIWLPLEPGQTFKTWYQAYAWTPPPFSDNANKNAPQHVVEAGWARMQIMAFPQRGKLVTG